MMWSRALSGGVTLNPTGTLVSKPPLLGLQCAQALEKAGSTANAFNNNSALTFSLNWQY